MLQCEKRNKIVNPRQVLQVMNFSPEKGMRCSEWQSELLGQRINIVFNGSWFNSDCHGHIELSQ